MQSWSLPSGRFCWGCVRHINYGRQTKHLHCEEPAHRAPEKQVDTSKNASVFKLVAASVGWGRGTHSAPAPRQRRHPQHSSLHPLQRRRPLSDAAAAGIPRPAELLLPPIRDRLELLERQPVQIVDKLRFDRGEPWFLDRECCFRCLHPQLDRLPPIFVHRDQERVNAPLKPSSPSAATILSANESVALRRARVRLFGVPAFRPPVFGVPLRRPAISIFFYFRKRRAASRNRDLAWS